MVGEKVGVRKEARVRGWGYGRSVSEDEAEDSPSYLDGIKES